MGVGGPTLMRGFGVENRSYGGHRRWCLDERHSVNQRTARIGGGVAKPRAARIVVDFPAPFDPRKPVTLSSSAVKLALSSTVLRPKRLVRPLSLS